MSTPVIAIFDVGKTNKKLFLFDEAYNIVFERTAQFNETTDEDGDPCENLESLTESLFHALEEVMNHHAFDVRAVNFATYGASFVYIDEQGKAVAPLYNYLKSYPEALRKKFYDAYGGETKFAFETASPVLGSLNSGMQLYRMKYDKPGIFSRTKWALHLPQYMSFSLTRKPTTDITSVGCHTNLWDFTKHQYHRWVKNETIDEKLPPIVPSDSTYPVSLHGKTLPVGVGLHDSSAALIPYLVNFHEPFVLISTGTWCISLNPFNHSALTAEALDDDCLCYLHYKGKPVKASRLFAGHFHDQESERIAAHFQEKSDFYKSIQYNPDMMAALEEKYAADTDPVRVSIKEYVFNKRPLNNFTSAIEAYHQLMRDLVAQQRISTQLILEHTKVKRIFVDGGFSKNPLYMNLLASSFSDIEVYAASMPQATAMGAALAIHDAWNKRAQPKDLIRLTYYSAAKEHQP